MVAEKQLRVGSGGLIRVDGRGVYSIAPQGMCTLEFLSEAIVAVSNLLAEQQDACALVFDAREMTSFVPGSPARVIKFFAQQVAEGKVVCGAVVTTHPTVLALTRAAAVMVPKAEVVSTATLAEALDICSRTVSRMRRPRTDEHAVIRNVPTLLAARKKHGS